MMYPQLADAVAEYRAAVNFLRHDNSHTHLHQQAVDVVTKTGHVFYEVDVTCVVCGGDYTQMFPLSAIASWAPTDKPRGVCAKH